MVRIEVHGQRLVRIRMDGESLGDWQIRGEGILGRRCLCGTISTPKGHRQSVRTSDVNRDWIIGRIRELEASAQARVVTLLQYWGWAKYQYREVPKTTFATAKLATLDSCPIEVIQCFIN